MKPMRHLFLIPNDCLVYTDYIFSNIHEIIMHSYTTWQIFYVAVTILHTEFSFTYTVF